MVDRIYLRKIGWMQMRRFRNAAKKKSAGQNQD